MHQPARGVAPVQRALGPAQDLDALDIEEGNAGCAGGRDIGLVPVERHRRLLALREIKLAHAADGKERDVRRIAGIAGGDQPRRLRRHIERIVPAERRDLRVVEGRDRDANVLQALLLLLRGDDDFFQDLGIEPAGEGPDKRGKHRERR